jgi:GTPase Era involved in 16S rRNA processing
MSEEEKQFYSFNMPAILVMNKVDLVTSKRRLKTLQHEIEDLCSFDKIFHTSCETGFGLEAVREYLVEKARLRQWRYHPNQSSTKSEVGKAEEALKQAVMEQYYKEIPY